MADSAPEKSESMAQRGRAVLKSENFLDFIDLLEQHQVRYLLIGGYAVNLHGHIRNTKDIDFWFDRTPENCERLEQVTRDFGVLAFDAEELLEPGMVFQTGFAPERIDLLNGAGPDFSAVYERAEQIPIPGTRAGVKLVSKPDLIELKKLAGRLQDLSDIERLGGGRQR